MLGNNTSNRVPFSRIAFWDRKIRDINPATVSLESTPLVPPVVALKSPGGT